MPVSPNHLALLDTVVERKQAGDIYTAFDELKEYALAACDALNQQATKAEQLRERLSDILADTLMLDTIGDALDESAGWLYDEGELKKHLAVLSDALDEWEAAA
jgi:GTP1/Obg family GTP-binding protein